MHGDDRKSCILLPHGRKYCMATENITLQSCCCCTQHPRCQTPTAAVRNSTSISRNLHKMPLIMHAPFLEEKLGWQSFGEKKEIRMPLYFPHQGSWQACIFNRLIALQITIYTNWSVEKVMSISHQTSSTTILVSFSVSFFSSAATKLFGRIMEFST